MAGNATNLILLAIDSNADIAKLTACVATLPIAIVPKEWATPADTFDLQAGMCTRNLTKIRANKGNLGQVGSVDLVQPIRKRHLGA
jgi:hypothetical protein